MIVRPGPPAIAPGQCPGGVVLHVYDTAGPTLVLTRHLTSLAAAEASAFDDADAVVAALRGDAECCLVAYDGDTGARFDLRAVMGRDRLP